MIHHSIGTGFSYNGRNIQLKTTENGERTEVNFGFMQYIPTLLPQLFSNSRCLNAKLKKGGPRTTQTLVNSGDERICDINTRPYSHTSVCIVSQSGVLPLETD